MDINVEMKIDDLCQTLADCAKILHDIWDLLDSYFKNQPRVLLKLTAVCSRS